MSDHQPTLHVGRRFRVVDQAQALDWLATYNLGSLISAGADGWPRASASPLIIRSDEEGQARLYAHLDRRNPQVEDVREKRPLLYVAQGPRAYVSPGWFPRRPAAPTYLHVTVHVRGHAEPLDEEHTPAATRDRGDLRASTAATVALRQRRALPLRLGKGCRRLRTGRRRNRGGLQTEPKTAAPRSGR